MGNKLTTIEQLLRNAAYPKKTILEKLICHSTKLSKKELFTKVDQELTPEQATRIDQAYTRYVEGKEPLEYILGYVEFHGNKFMVDRACLIPRPETEYMIEAIKEYTTQDGSPKTSTLLDIGTGCGVLGLSVCLHCPDSIQEAYFTDLSQEALDLSKKNRQKHLSSLEKKDIPLQDSNFLQASLLDNSKLQELLSDPEQDILLVANLPYIPDQLFDENTDDTVKKWEPRMAFVGGDDGLDLYRIMFDQLLGLPGEGKNTTMFLEMMTWQVEILRQEYPSMSFEEVKTFHFNIRIVKAKVV